MQKIRNHVKAFLIIFILFFSGGCNNWLDLEPENALVMEEFWNSKEDIEAVLAAM